MTLRRLFLLVRYTPGDDVLWQAIEAHEEREKTRAMQRRLRERRAHYRGGAE